MRIVLVLPEEDTAEIHKITALATTYYVLSTGCPLYTHAPWPVLFCLKWTACFDIITFNCRIVVEAVTRQTASGSISAVFRF